LFSAAYRSESGLTRLWQVNEATLLSSTYAVEQARRNLALQGQSALDRLELLLRGLTIVAAQQDFVLSPRIKLDAKDRPILLGAIQAKADYLLTGDVRHFSHLYGRRIEGVLVLRPAQYFRKMEG
jgi:predicted nucleic acid-binding protein